MVVDPNRDVDAANQYQCYRKGWLDGVHCHTRALNPLFTKHSTRALAEAYEAGYRDGVSAQTQALQHASKTYGYTPSILRSAP